MGQVREAKICKNKTKKRRKNNVQPYVRVPMCERHPKSDTKSLQAMLFPDPMPPQTPNTRTGDGSLLPPAMFSTTADVDDNTDANVVVVPMKEWEPKERNDEVAVDRLQADTTERTADVRIRISSACLLMKLVIDTNVGR